MKQSEETDILKLIRAIDSLAGKIAVNIEMSVNGEEDDEGKPVEVSHKLVDTFVKLIDKADKLKTFSDLLISLNDPEGKTAPKKQASLSKEKSKKVNIQDFVLDDQS